MASAAVAIPYDIEYPAICHVCKAAGEKSQLRFSTSDGIFCSRPGEPHRFATVAEGEGTEAPAQAKPAAEAPEVKLSGFDQKVFSGLAPKDASSAEERKHRMGEVIQEKMREAARKAPIPAAVPPSAAEPASVLVGRRDVARILEAEEKVIVGAGEMKLTVTLRERHVAAVQAEYGVQRSARPGLTLAQYFDEWLERALDSFWGQV